MIFYIIFLFSLNCSHSYLYCFLPSDKFGLHLFFLFVSFFFFLSLLRCLLRLFSFLFEIFLFFFFFFWGRHLSFWTCLLELLLLYLVSLVGCSSVFLCLKVFLKISLLISSLTHYSSVACCCISMCYEFSSFLFVIDFQFHNFIVWKDSWCDFSLMKFIVA